MRRACICLALVVGLSSAQAPQRLSAQIRMPRPKVPNPLDRVTQPPAARPRTPTYDDRVLEITDARITALVRGLRAEQQQRPVLEAAYRKNADDRAAAQVAARRQGDRVSSAQACLINSPEYRAIYGDTAAQRKTAERLEAARERGDEATVKFIEDSVMQAMMTLGPSAAMGLMQAQQRCGAADLAVTAPTPVAAPQAAPSTRLGDSLRILGTAATGLTAEQYAMLRERVLAYLSIDEQELRGSLWAFGAGELTVLRARKSELQRYQSTLAEE